MKLQSSVVPLSVIAASHLVSALVIPDLSDEANLAAKVALAKSELKSEISSLEKTVVHDVKQIFEEFEQKYGKTLQSLRENLEKSSVRLAPLLSPITNSVSAQLVPNRYIVVFKNTSSEDEIALHKEFVQQAHIQSVATLPSDHEFFTQSIDSRHGLLDSFDIEGSLRGYIGHFTEEIVNLIRLNPAVEFVERDSMVTTKEYELQSNAPWGLARISHREPIGLGNFNKYQFDDNAGSGVDAYVIDTGINIHHVDFEGRAKWGITIPSNDQDIDGNGHGTHCAGTIGSKHYGVAKKANLIAVKVLRSNGAGTMSDVLKGVEWVTKAHKARVKSGDKNFKGSTANMSLGGGKSMALELVVDAAVKAGVHFAVAAGNENQDACDTSPASSKYAITVGASTLTDSKASFSNWGECVDIFAPGVNILSTYTGADNHGVSTLSGTSMASPHVAGLLAYFLSLQPDAESEYANCATTVAGSGKGGSPMVLTPAQLKKKLVDFSTKDVLMGLPDGTQNYLAYNGAGDDLRDFWCPSEKSDISGTTSTTTTTATSDNAKTPVHRWLQDLINFENLAGSGHGDSVFENVRNAIDNLNIL